jgi:hypothetical protein
MKPLKALIILSLSLSFSLACYSQQITNVQAGIQGENIVVTYNLSSTDANARYDIKLYASHNNFSAPVNLVSGDVGGGITPGNGKRITWQARQELNTFSGNITFEVRGTLIAPSQPDVESTDPNQLKFSNPRLGDKFKMGSIMSVRWTGGLPQDIKLELHKDNIMVQPLASAQNSGSYNWNVPKDKSLKAGNYTLKLFNINQPQSAAFSGAFKIKGKVPVVIYILPVVAVGGLVAVLLSGGGGGDDGNGTTTDGNLPSPPRPDGGG